jgi:hypothetical protein
MVKMLVIRPTRYVTAKPTAELDVSCCRTASVTGSFAIAFSAVPIAAEAPSPPAIRPAAPPALNPNNLPSKYALARPTAQNKTESPICGRALRPSPPKNCGPVSITDCEKEQSKERPLDGRRRWLNAKLANHHASQDDAHDSIQLERANAEPGNSMPHPKHQKQSNLRVSL